jgi:hypothetical protein
MDEGRVLMNGSMQQLPCLIQIVMFRHVAAGVAPDGTPAVTICTLGWAI